MNKKLGAILGLAVGDALGVPVEFSSRAERVNDPVTDMRAYGTHEQPAGTWSDDTSMTVATLEWLGEANGGHLDYSKLFDKFVGWILRGEYTPYGDAFDHGITTNKGIFNYDAGIDPVKCGGTSVFDNGNGSLMRIIPMALYLKDELSNDNYKNAQLIYDMSALTHGHGRSKLACLIYCKIVVDLLSENTDIRSGLESVKHFVESEEKDNEIVEELATYNRLFEFDSFKNLPVDEIKSTGYVVDTLEAAIWCLANSSSFEECVLKAVNLGDDTDTVGAVAGGLAGALYGLDAIPSEWIDIIPKKDWMMDLVRGM